MVIRERRPLPNRSFRRETNERTILVLLFLFFLLGVSFFLLLRDTRQKGQRQNTSRLASSSLTGKNHPKMRKCAKFRAKAAPPPLSSTRRSRAPKKSRIARRVHRNARMRKKNTTQSLPNQVSRACSQSRTSSSSFSSSLLMMVAVVLCSTKK